MTNLRVVATANGRSGPLNGPFFFVSEDADAAGDLIDALIGFVRIVVGGVSSYNKNGMEESSNLKSYAFECFEELQAEAPEAAGLLENLRIDCSLLPQAIKDHPIWKLDRAILRTLPGISFVD